MKKLLTPNNDWFFEHYQKMIAIIIAFFCNAMLFAEDVDDLPPPGDEYYAANWALLGIALVIILVVLALLLIVLLITVTFAIVSIVLLFSKKYRPKVVCYLWWTFFPFVLPYYAKKSGVIMHSWQSWLLVPFSPFMMFFCILTIMIAVIMIAGKYDAALDFVKTTISFL